MFKSTTARSGGGGNTLIVSIFEGLESQMDQYAFYLS